MKFRIGIEEIKAWSTLGGWHSYFYESITRQE